METSLLRIISKRRKWGAGNRKENGTGGRKLLKFYDEDLREKQEPE